MWNQPRTENSRSRKLLFLIPAGARWTGPHFHGPLGWKRVWRGRGSGYQTLFPHSLSPLATASHWLNRRGQRGLEDTVYSAQPETETWTERAENRYSGQGQVKKSAQCGGPLIGVYIPQDCQQISENKVSTNLDKF